MRARLAGNRVVAAAVTVARRDGFGAVTLRSVASELGVTPMALYRYVADAGALRRATLDAIGAEVPEVRDSGDLGADLHEWAVAARAALQPYAGAATALVCEWFATPSMLERVDGLLARAERGGLHDFDAVAVTNAVMTFVLMRVQVEEQVRRAGVVQRSLRTRGVARPLSHLRRLARHYERADFDAHFTFGLDALLRGARAQVPA